MSRKLTVEQKRLNRLITERGRLAMQESLLGTRFDLVKNRIREIESEIRDTYKNITNDDNAGFPKLNEMEKQYCREGNPIMAIKAMRERLNIGLKEAKDAIVHYRQTNGLMQEA